ncbi:hypothetical protein Q4543_01705 [Salipiger sp. 1_MG-2023]|uniref:hypothetical protein n=1 Tax=Salipiger sp. 1_MG-2023 TaxID=3062665 RepID=UPI0026E1565D|nr:hypothetical protein [Salipiger sp. 1_MG-2023]MDO6584221.1 hypothetical protein [Salipiger sp. 1_MG-2023]
MRHEHFERSGVALRPPEWRIVRMLRTRDDIGPIEAELAANIGDARAAQAIDGFLQVLAMLGQHGWNAPLILRPGARSVSDDELNLARFVLHCAEQDRDTATAEAMMLVAPQAILPLVEAGTRLGLPLLCEECRDRLRCPLTFQ